MGNLFAPNKEKWIKKQMDNIISKRNNKPFIDCENYEIPCDSYLVRYALVMYYNEKYLDHIQPQEGLRLTMYDISCYID